MVSAPPWLGYKAARLLHVIHQPQHHRAGKQCSVICSCAGCYSCAVVRGLGTKILHVLPSGIEQVIWNRVLCLICVPVLWCCSNSNKYMKEREANFSFLAITGPSTGCHIMVINNCKAVLACALDQCNVHTARAKCCCSEVVLCRPVLCWSGENGFPAPAATGVKASATHTPLLKFMRRFSPLCVVLSLRTAH